MFKVIKAIGAAWEIFRWLRKTKKEMESDVDEFFTPDRAREYRLAMEKVFYALERGNGNFDKLPKWLRWLFAQTTADNKIGLFGLHLLKSQKLRDGADVLNQPIYPCH